MSVPLTKIDNLECDEVISVGGLLDAVSTLNIAGTKLTIVDATNPSLWSRLVQDSLSLVNSASDQCILDVDAKSLTFQPNGGAVSTYASDHLEIVETLGSKATLSGSGGLVLLPDTGGLGSVQLASDRLQITFPDGSGSLALYETGIFIGYPDGSGLLQLTETQFNMVGPDGKAILYAQEGMLRMYNADDIYYQGIDKYDGFTLESGAKKYGPLGVNFGANNFDITSAGLTINTLAGTAGQVLESSGDGVAPVWADLPSAYVNPLKMFTFAIPSAPQASGTITFSDLGDDRVFTVPPVIMLMVADTTGVVVPVSLNGVYVSNDVYVSFGWVASSAVSALSVSVYSLG